MSVNQCLDTFRILRDRGESLLVAVDALHHGLCAAVGLILGGGHGHGHGVPCFPSLLQRHLHARHVYEGIHDVRLAYCVVTAYVEAVSGVDGLQGYAPIRGFPCRHKHRLCRKVFAASKPFCALANELIDAEAEVYRHFHAHGGFPACVGAQHKTCRAHAVPGLNETVARRVHPGLTLYTPPLVEGEVTWTGAVSVRTCPHIHCTSKHLRGKHRHISCLELSLRGVTPE